MAKPFDTKTFLAKIGEGKTLLSFKDRKTIFKQNDIADSVFYIQQGKVKITYVSEQGKEGVVGFLDTDQFFGEGCLIGHTVRVSTATAVGDCKVTSISRPAMQRLIANEPQFMQFFLAYLLNRNVRIEEDLVDQLFNSVEQRLARLLLLLAHFGDGGTGDSAEITSDITQETLSEMIGATRGRISYFMNKFRRLGLINYNGHITVNRTLLNQVLREKPAIAENDEDRERWTKPEKPEKPEKPKKRKR